MKDPYLYEKSNVLKNKLNIKNKECLDKEEVNFTSVAIYEIAHNPIIGNYDFSHFCKFNLKIFEDLYDWAGKPRTVPMEKAEKELGYMSIEYSEPTQIIKSATQILNEMNSKKWEKMSLDEQAINLSNDMAMLWKVHAFREGNTRTTITFICQFAESKGMLLDRSIFEKNASYTRQALVAACAYFKDGSDFRKSEYLNTIIKDSLELGKKLGEKSMSMSEWKDKIKREQTNVEKKRDVVKER